MHTNMIWLTRCFFSIEGIPEECGELGSGGKIKETLWLLGITGKTLMYSSNLWKHVWNYLGDYNAWLI